MPPASTRSCVGQAVKGRRDKFLIASKFGNIRGPGGQRGGVNGKPDYVPVACEASLKRMGIDHIDLYYIHRIDPNVPIEDTVGAMSRLIEQGKVRYLGLCEAGANTLRRAHKMHPLAAMRDRILAVDAATSKRRSFRRCANSGSAWSPTRRSAADSSAAPSRSATT